jgi:hypothetical protein
VTPPPKRRAYHDSPWKKKEKARENEKEIEKSHELWKRENGKLPKKTHSRFGKNIKVLH